MIRATIVALLLTLTACQGGEPVEGSVNYFHDTDHGVGCWTVWGNGIYCLPDSEYQVVQP